MSSASCVAGSRSGDTVSWLMLGNFARGHRIDGYGCQHSEPRSTLLLLHCGYISLATWPGGILLLHCTEASTERHTGKETWRIMDFSFYCAVLLLLTQDKYLIRCPAHPSKVKWGKV